MASATPGPWYIYEGNPHWVMATDPDDDTPWLVAKVEPYAGPGDATPANARLIAAAPCLLAAAQSLADAFPESDEDNTVESIWGRYGAELAAAVRDARAALSNATTPTPAGDAA